MAEMEPVQGTEPDTNEEEEENEDDDDIYEVEKIVGMSVSPQGSRLYKVRWAGYSPSWDTWEPQDNLLSCLDMIEDYTKQEEEKRRTREEEKRLKREQEGAGHSKRRKMHYDEEKSDGDVDTVKDTFWRDLEEGKINVFQTGDLYSKVKSQGRAARPTSFTPLFTSPRKGNSQEEERPPKQKGKRGRKPKTSKEVKISKTSDKVQQMTALKDFVLISDDEEDNVMINVKSNEPHSDLTKKDHKEVDEMELKPKQESSSGIISLVNKKMKDKTKKKREEIKGHTTKANDGKQTKKIKKEKLQSAADVPVKTDPDCPKITKINDKSKAQSTSEDVKNEMSELTMVFTKSEKGIATEKDVNEGEKKKEKLTEEAEKVPKKKRIKLDEDPGIKITITSSDPVTTNGEFMEDSQLTTTITTTTSTNQTLDTNSSSSKDEIILEEFTEERWNEMGAELLEAIEISNSDLKHAVKEGMYERVRKALNSQKQYNLEQPDQMGMTLVMLAAAKGFDDLVELLVINGANMNAKAKTGNTPLMFAAENGHLCTVAVLLALGAHINIQNGSQETALIKATKKGHNQIVKMLLENGADFSAENATGNTALKYAKLLNSVELQATINQHVKKLTALFTQQVYLTMNNTAETVCSLFPLHVLPLNEGDKFVIHFNHELQPTVPGVGMLLFVAHARITPQETKCRLSGPCAVKTAILNGVAQPTLTDEGQFVLSFSPLHNGRNELIIHTVYAPTSRAKLVVGAYKAKLLPNSEQ
ncbi:M-phase phosphoprotein 8 isoform X4 [Lingula anatina]|uniref:M-phase phosphoprotein 8 isoform X4 n=1 Tax=Lingula anatina TaxID=7574 RepID=A0A1S3HLD8_LINAN|nr:M-phase phosphoprotein 8 isoform X4 [Lingula anatina]|eukprot:XP_013386276.1 M-phase phosphoprotein 8 isoform X4 [Lingula anatina]